MCISITKWDWTERSSSIQIEAMYNGQHVMNLSIRQFVACCFSLCSMVVVAEEISVVNSNEVLDSAYLSSTYHRVENVDFINGFYVFDVESDFGQLELVSKALFLNRVDEIKTLGEAMTLYDRENRQLSYELRSGLQVTANSPVDIIANPFGTASELATQLSNNLGDTLTGKSPFIEEYASRYVYSEPKDPTTAAHKRNTAYQMQLDLYSGSYRVQTFLNTIANARSAGRVSAGVGVGRGFFNTRRQSALDLSIRQTLKNRTLEELNQSHRNVLLRLDTNLLQTDAFMGQPFLSPTNRTVMLSYLEQISGVEDLKLMIEMINNTDNEVTTLVFERLCKSLYFYYNRDEQFTRFVNFEQHPAVTTAANRIVFFEHRDHFIWDENNQDTYSKLAEAAFDNGYLELHVVSLGTFSDKASEELKQLGYKTKQEYLTGLSE